MPIFICIISRKTACSGTSTPVIEGGAQPHYQVAAPVSKMSYILVLNWPEICVTVYPMEILTEMPMTSVKIPAVDPVSPVYPNLDHRYKTKLRPTLLDPWYNFGYYYHKNVTI